MDLLASYLVGRGYAGLSFDFVGHKLGATGGEMQHIRQAVENVGAAVHWLRTNSSAEKIVLIGHSMGAAASIAYAAEDQERRGEGNEAPIAGLICLCMGTQPVRGFTDTIGRAMLTQRADYVAGAPASQLLMEIETLLSAADRLGDLPSLFLAARQDVLIPPARIEALAQRVGSSATFRIIEATHLDAPDKARGAVIEWIEGLYR